MLSQLSKNTIVIARSLRSRLNEYLVKVVRHTSPSSQVTARLFWSFRCLVLKWLTRPFHTWCTCQNALRFFCPPLSEFQRSSRIFNLTTLENTTSINLKHFQFYHDVLLSCFLFHSYSHKNDADCNNDLHYLKPPKDDIFRSITSGCICKYIFVKLHPRFNSKAQFSALFMFENAFVTKVWVIVSQFCS